MANAQNAYDAALTDYNSQGYKDYYNNLAPSSRAFMHAPGSASTGNYLATQAAQSFNDFNGMSSNNQFNVAMPGGSANATPNTPTLASGGNYPAQQPTLGNNQPSPVGLPGQSQGFQPWAAPANNYPGYAQALGAGTQPKPNSPIMGNQPSPVALPYASGGNTNPVMGNTPSPVPLPKQGGLVLPENTISKVAGGPAVPNTQQAGTLANPTPKLGTNGFNYDPTTGQATIDGQPWTNENRRDPRIWGASGGYLTNNDYSQLNPNDNPGEFRDFENYARSHPQYFEPYTVTKYDGDNGPTSYTSYRLNADTKTKLNGRVQLPQLGQGGYSEMKDPSKVEFDPEFGLLTTPDNIGAQDQFNNPRMLQAALAAGGVAAGAGVAGMLGVGPLAAGAGGAGDVAVPGMLAADTIPAASPGLMTAPSLYTGGGALGAAGAGAAAAGGGGSTLGTIASGARTAASAASLIRAATGGNSSSSGSSSGGGFGGTLADIVGGGAGLAASNSNISSFNSMINDMLTRGDPYSGQRADAINRLRTLESNPGSVTSNPLFSAMNDKSQTDVQRIMAARGLGVSGNEMGALQENYLANMNKFYGDEWNRTAREAGVFVDPSYMAGQGMRAGGDLFQARDNRNTGVSSLISGILGGNRSGSNLSGSDIQSIYQFLFGGNGNSNSIDVPDNLPDPTTGGQDYPDLMGTPDIIGY